MRSLPDELQAAYDAGDYHGFLAIKIEQTEALHASALKADPKHYAGRELVRQIEMLKACDLAMWQMKEALGYPIPSTVDERYPRQLAGNAGKNPFECGSCGARKAYPDLHLKHDAEQQGGMYVAPADFVKA